MKKVKLLVVLICLLPNVHGMILKKIMTKKGEYQKGNALLSEERIKKYFNEDQANTKEIILIESSLVLLGEKENMNRCEITKGVTHIHQIKFDKFKNLKSPIFTISNKINSNGFGMFAISNLEKNILDLLKLFKSIDVSVLAVIFDDSPCKKRCKACKEKYKINTKSSGFINNFDDGCSQKNINQLSVSDKKRNRSSKNVLDFDLIMKMIELEEKKNQCEFKKFTENIKNTLKKNEFNAPIFFFSNKYSEQIIETFVSDFDSLKN